MCAFGSAQFNLANVLDGPGSVRAAEFALEQDFGVYVVEDFA